MTNIRTFRIRLPSLALVASALFLCACTTTTTQSFNVVKNPNVDSAFVAADADFSQYAIEEITESLLQPYFEACEAALADGIVEDADVLDAGLIFGTGFAPFRGGPLHYLNQRGAQQ